MFGAAQRQSAPAAMQRGCGEVDDNRLPSVSAVIGDNNPSTGAASDGPNADVNTAQSHATRVAARDVEELSRKRCSRANFVSKVAHWSVNRGQYVSFPCHNNKKVRNGSGSCGCCHLKQTGRCCLQRLGGIDHAFAIRRDHWKVEFEPVALTPSDDSAAPVAAAAAVKRKRLQQKQRTAKLVDLLQQMVHYSKDDKGNLTFVDGDAEHYALGYVTKSFEAGSEASSQCVPGDASAANQLNVITSRRHSMGEVQLYLPNAYPQVMTPASWVEADHFFKSIVHGTAAKPTKRKRQKTTRTNQRDKPEKQVCSLSDVIVTQGLLGEALKPVSINAGRAVQFKVSDESSAEAIIANTEELKFAIKTLIEHDRCFDAVKLGEREKVCGQCMVAFQKLSVTSDSQRLNAAAVALVGDGMGEYGGQSHRCSVRPPAE